MQGRNILDGVVILHETVHELHRKKANGVILEIDFEKTYDKVKLFFLQQTLRMNFFWRNGVLSHIISLLVVVLLLKSTMIWITILKLKKTTAR